MSHLFKEKPQRISFLMPESKLKAFDESLKEPNLRSRVLRVLIGDFMEFESYYQKDILRRAKLLPPDTKKLLEKI